MNLDDTLLERIIPSAEEKDRIRAIAEEIREIVQVEVSRRGLDVDVRLMGSVAKDTFLSDPDLDIFLLFPSDFPAERMEAQGLDIGETILKGDRMYADHPYIRGAYKGLDVDLVPCYALCDTNCLQSAVDRTPFHTAYILEHMDDDTKDQARVLKAFMKGIGVYGAEPAIRGFSGYLTELLALHYGDFRSVLEAAAAWRNGTVIGKGMGNPSIEGPLIFFDPVDPRRNVASAVHIDTFSLFITACREYLKDPKEEFFFPKVRADLVPQVLRDIIEGRQTRMLVVTIGHPDINSETLDAQMWKTEDGIVRLLETEGFRVLGSTHLKGHELQFMFELEDDHLSPVKKHVGPPIWMENANSFLEKWREGGISRPFIKDGRWNILVERRPDEAGDAVSLGRSRMAHGQNIDLSTMSVHRHDEILDERFSAISSKLLDKRFSWEL